MLLGVGIALVVWSGAVVKFGTRADDAATER